MVRLLSDQREKTNIVTQPSNHDALLKHLANEKAPWSSYAQKNDLQRAVKTFKRKLADKISQIMTYNDFWTVINIFKLLILQQQTSHSA